MTSRSPIRVARVYHGGRDPAHVLRDRALIAQGVDLTLIVPLRWKGGGAIQAEPLADAGVRVLELPVQRPGDVNRHRYANPHTLRALLDEVKLDLLDVHEEPVSLAMRQLLKIADPDLHVVGYTAQNLDKRFPPPFARYERRAYGRLAGLYPCSRQAAAVAWGKGFRGKVRVLPLGHDPALFHPGNQSLAGEITLALAGRLVREKGIVDAVRVLAAVRRQRPARLVLVGEGPALPDALAEADRLGVREVVRIHPWLGHEGLAELYRQAHVVLAPSRSSPTWVEQFGRMIVEAQASGAVVAGYASGSIPEVAGDTAVLVPEADVDMLASAVVALVLDSERWEALRAAGLASAAKRTWEAVARDQVAFYEEVLNGPLTFPVAPADALSRAEARERFGPPATAGGVERPFADPVLRRLGRWQDPAGHAVNAVGRVLGGAVDVTGGVLGGAVDVAQALRRWVRYPRRTRDR